MTRNHREISILALILALATALQLTYGLLDQAPDFDEAIYMGLARGITRHYVPRISEDTPVFLLHPPLFYYLESLTFLPGEPPLVIARLPSTLLSLLTLWLLYRVCRVVWDGRRGLMAAGLLAVNPAFVYYSHSVYMEPTVAFLGMLCLALWFGSGSERPCSALAGFAGGCAFLAKYFGIFFLLGIAVSAVSRAGSARPVLRLLTACLCTASIWPLFAFLLDSQRFLHGLAFFTSSPLVEAAAHSWRSESVARYMVYQVGVLTPALAVLAVAGIILEVRSTWGGSIPSRRRRFVVCCIAVLLLFSLFCLLTSRRDVKYFVPALPLLALFGARPLLAMFDRVGTSTTRAGLAMVAALLLTPMTWLYNPLARTWHPNIVVFGVQRDGRYLDLLRIGRLIRQDRAPNSLVLTEAKASLVGYYGDLPAKDLWGHSWSSIEPRLAAANYYVASSDAAYLDAAALRARDAYLDAEFEKVISYQSDGITQTLYRRSSTQP